MACVLVTAQAKPVALEGAWRPAHPHDDAQRVVAEARAGHLARFNASKMQTFGDPRQGTWVVLLAQPGSTEGAEPMMLSIRSSPLTSITLYSDGDAQPLYTNSLDNFSPHPHGYGRIIFPIPAGRAIDTPILLKIEPNTYPAGPISFTLASTRAFRIGNDLWLAALGACFGVMMAMATMGLCFGGILRDSTFIWYATYMFAFAAIQSVQTGFLYHPLGMSALSGDGGTIIGLALAVAAPCAAMFMLRFCDIETYAPLLVKPVVALTVAMVAVALGRLVPIPSVHMVAGALINPMLILGTLAMLVGGIASAVRGSRSAWFFLIGWTPLLVVTAMASAQSDGAFPQLAWLNDAGVPAGALEALILSAGLADRALNIRRDRDRARELAERDPLTGVLNRRGWLDAAQKRLLNIGRRPQSVLFLDLDHFKTLNDELGHAAGDRALIAVADVLGVDLRPQDILGRFGGEEFIIFLDDTPPHDAMHIAVRLRRRIYRLELPVTPEGDVLTVSIGVAHARPEDTLSQLIERADDAMYGAKAGGRNRVVAESDIARKPRRPHLHAVPPPDPMGERAGLHRHHGLSPGLRGHQPDDES